MSWNKLPVPQTLAISEIIGDKKRTLQELKYFKKNNQIAFIDQKALDVLLVFNSSYEVEGYDAKS